MTYASLAPSAPLTFAQDAAASGGMTASELFHSVVDKLDILNKPDELLTLLSDFSFFNAAVAVVLGVLCMLNGYRWHKWVMIVLAFFGGYLIGTLLSQHMGRSAIIAVSLGLLFAIVTGPMLKVMVAIFAGITGAFIGANVWSAVSTMPTDMSWAGAAMGFIVLAMASLIVFRLVGAYVLAFPMGLGLKGIWLAIVIDISIRGVVFAVYYRTGRWMKASV